MLLAGRRKDAQEPEDTHLEEEIVNTDGSSSLCDAALL